MPFLAPSLPADEIDVILRWVEAGLPETNNDLEQSYRANEASQSP
jgi:hypothetical protein